MISMESLLEQAASGFPYPPTPDLAHGVMAQLAVQEAAPAVNRRRLALAAAAVLIVLAGLLAVPQVRAAILEALRIGAVSIFLDEPSPEPGLKGPMTPPAQAGASPETQKTQITSSPTATPWTAGITGETTLEEAASQLDFPLQLPGYPQDVGTPDQVFLPDIGGQAVVMVWYEPGNADELRFALYEIGAGVALGKSAPSSVEETRVNGNKAIWITTAHDLFDLTRSGGMMRRVNSNVLVWEDSDLTYRLETWLDKEEAVRIAESLQ